MKRIVPLFAVAILILTGASSMLAQGKTDAFNGTWKLNVSKSQYKGTSAPQSSTITIEAQGSGEKVSVEGTASDGSHVAYSYTSNLDGKPAHVSGTGIPNGADSYALKRVDSNTRTNTSTKAGKVVRTGRTVVSKDGKVLTLTTKGIDAKGQPTSTVSIYERQ